MAAVLAEYCGCMSGKINHIEGLSIHECALVAVIAILTPVINTLPFSIVLYVGETDI